MKKPGKASIIETKEKNESKTLIQKKEFALKKRYYFILIFVLIALAYGQTIFYDYSYFDDDAVIVNNTKILSDFSNIGKSFTTDAELNVQKIELYRPLQTATYFIDTLIGGVNPKAFHFGNFILHILTCFALYFLLIKLKIPEQLAFLFTMLLAVHALFSHAVAWIPSRGDLLLGLTGILTFSMYFSYLSTNKKLYLFLHLSFFILALLSKETAIFAGPLCIIAGVIILKKNIFQKINFLLATCYICFGFFYFILRKNAISPVSDGIFGLNALLQNMATIPELFSLFFIPINIPLMPFYSSFRIISGIILIAVILIFIVRNKHYSNPLFILGMIWFIVFAVPAMLYRPEWSNFSYDYLTHRSYFPFVGIFIASSVFFKNVNFSSKKYLRISLIIILPLTLLSAWHSRVYKDTLSFTNAATQNNPESALAMQYFANATYMNGDYKGSIELYSKVISLKNDFADAWLNRGMANAKIKEYEKAESDFNKAYLLNPSKKTILKYMANAQFESKNYSSAVKNFTSYLNVRPNDSESLFKRGQSNFFLTKYVEAEKDFSTILDSNATDTDAMLMRGNIFILTHQPEKAYRDFKKILEINPTSIDACNNLGFIFIENSKADSAIFYFSKALLIDKNHADATLGMALGEQLNKNYEKSRQYFELACITEPLLKQGLSGINTLEKQGYFYTEKQKKLILELYENYKK